LSNAKEGETRQRQRERELIGTALADARTRDGRLVRVYGNIEQAGEADSVWSHGGEGVGLYRTEFLFMNRTEPPTEEDHLAAYRDLAQRAQGRTITIRSLDLGGDKLFAAAEAPHERNPALGLRAIRLCLQQPDLLRTQIRAVMQVAMHAKVRLLVPMVTQLSEIQSVKDLIAEVTKALQREGIPHASKVPLGIMIETPGTAIIADLLATEVDFFAIGTNDLIQYALAIDRGNENVAYLYRPLHPGILRLIAMVMDAASRHGVSVSLCGEMGADLLHIPVLLGLGLTELSMNATSIPWIKRMIRESDTRSCRALVDGLLDRKSPQEIEEEVRAFVLREYPDLAADMY
jgi:phosphotransferase system enzyme I (PtsI)